MFDDNQSELLTPDSSNLPNPVNPVNPVNLVNLQNQQLLNQMLQNPLTFSRLQELMKQRQKMMLLQQQIDALKDIETGKGKSIKLLPPPVVYFNQFYAKIRPYIILICFKAYIKLKVHSFPETYPTVSAYFHIY